MTYDRKSIPTLRGFETPASRLSAELQKLKIRPEPIIANVDPVSMEELGRALRAAAALQNAPDPIILIDVKSGKAILVNNASMERFPEIRAKGADHPALSGWKEAAHEFEAGRKTALSDYFHIGRSFERRASLSDGVLQVYFREKKDGQQIFYPFPVIDYTIALGFTSFKNEAARKAFPNAENHPIFSGIREAAVLMRKGALKGISDTITAEGRTFQRAALYLAQSDTIRIFASDITGSASHSKSKLLGICAFAEKAGSSGWTTGSIKELDRLTQDLMAAIKREKADLGKLELDLMKFTLVLRRMTASPPPQHELESFKSVVADFFLNLKPG
jgi:hypothetical protein